MKRNVLMENLELNMISIGQGVACLTERSRNAAECRTGDHARGSALHLPPLMHHRYPADTIGSTNLGQRVKSGDELPAEVY